MMKTLSIITLLAVLGTPAFGRPSLPERTTSDVKKLAEVCEAFRYQHGVYPPQETWLAELLASEEAVVNDSGSALIEPQAACDGWGRFFIYRFPGRHNPDSFDLYSLGADGATETNGDDPDDIGAWHDSGRWRQHYKSRAITTFQALMGMGMALSIVILVMARKRKELNPSTDDYT